MKLETVSKCIEVHMYVLPILIFPEAMEKSDMVQLTNVSCNSNHFIIC